MRADRHFVDGLFERIPPLRDFYWGRSARLKRFGCLALDRLGLLTPSSFVVWVCTYACNYGCSFCEASAGQAGPGELTTEEARALLEDVKRTGARRLLISGGVVTSCQTRFCRVEITAETWWRIKLTNQSR